MDKIVEDCSIGLAKSDIFYTEVTEIVQYRLGLNKS